MWCRLLFAALVASIIARCGAEYRSDDYVMVRVPQYMRHHGITNNWRWAPGYIGEERFNHVPPQTVRVTLYPKGYTRWGHGLDTITALEGVDLNSLACTNQWQAIRRALKKSLHDASEESLGKKTYLRLIAHAEGVGALSCNTSTQ
jgi:hypothetical protein